MSDFEYDVAFSFLEEDEQLAIDIDNKIGSKFETFIYSKRQKKLAGTDGQNTFSDIFRNKARTVVVLYREEWGNTKWTRAEETAIKTVGSIKVMIFYFLFLLKKLIYQFGTPIR